MAGCKCRYCKANLSTNTAYQVIENKKTAYFCNQEHYENYIAMIERKNKEKDKLSVNRDKAYRLICEIIGRKQIINTVLWKEWAIWNKVATDETIGQYLKENQAYLSSVIAKLEDVEFKRIRYLSAILKNELGDYKPKMVQVKEFKIEIDEIDNRTDVELRINKKKKMVRRQGFAEMEG